MTSVLSSGRPVSKLTLGRLTARWDEFRLWSHNVTGKVTSDPLSHYCDVWWEKKERYHNDDVTVAGVKTWKLTPPPRSSLVSFLVSFHTERKNQDCWSQWQDKLFVKWIKEKENKQQTFLEMEGEAVSCFGTQSHSITPVCWDTSSVH